MDESASKRKKNTEKGCISSVINDKICSHMVTIIEKAETYSFRKKTTNIPYKARNTFKRGSGLTMGQSLEIVIVDDEAQITELLKTFIKVSSGNARIHTFNDSTQAREYLLHNDIDVLITDYKMPRCNGLELLESVPAKVKKILISGYVSEIAEEKLLRMGVVFFEKPVPIKTLGKVISELEGCPTS